MKNVDRWFILIGLLYGTFGFAFGIWVGINERFEQAHLHAHINLIGFASMVMFGLLYRAFPALAQSKLAAVHFILFNLGAVVFLVGIPLALASARLLSGFLFGVRPADPLAFIAVVIGLSMITMLACLRPARVAATTDPNTVLRRD